LLSTILRASAKAAEGLGSRTVLASRSPSLVVDRDDEACLARQVEPVKVVSFGLEDHSSGACSKFKS
jgi:hypothetical protein